MPNIDSKIRTQFEVELHQMAQGKETITLTLSPIDAWFLMSQLQLACRIPGNQGMPRMIVEDIARRIQSHIADMPALRTVADQGWYLMYELPKPDREITH